MTHPYSGDDKPLSYSQMNTYGSCSRKWFFRYVKRAPSTRASGALTLGTAMHKTIQEAVMNNRHPDGMLPLFFGSWNAAIERNGDLPFNEDDMTKNFEAGMRMISAPAMPDAILKLQDVRMVSTELFVKFHLDGHTKPIIGYIDMLDNSGMAYDIKTAGRMWSDADFDNDRQSSLYLLGLIEMGIIEETYPLEFTFLIITKTKKPKWEFRTVQRTKDDMIRLRNWLKEMDDHIASGVHRADPRPNWVCNWCDYMPICKRGLIMPPV